MSSLNNPAVKPYTKKRDTSAVSSNPFVMPADGVAVFEMYGSAYTHYTITNQTTGMMIRNSEDNGGYTNNMPMAAKAGDVLVGDVRGSVNGVQFFPFA